MAENFSRSVLRIVIAQLSQSVGFDTIQASSLDILTNVLERYLLVVGKTIHDYGEQRGQTTPSLEDVNCAFQQLNISLADILEYTKQMEPIAFAQKVAKFPAPKECNLGFPSGTNPEDFKRDEHIPLYMPSLMITAPKPVVRPETEDMNAEKQPAKKGTFVIAGKHTQGYSSDEDIYSAGGDSSEEYISDDSLAHNPSKSRHLTKPEDIPMVEGTAPSSLMSIPSTSELDELRGGISPPRGSNLDTSDDHIEKSFSREKRGPIAPSKFSGAKKSVSESSSDMSWLSPSSGKQQSFESDKSSRKSVQSKEPDWLTDKKKPDDVYDPGWLQDDDASPVHLNKPPTPDVPISSPTLEKRSWFSKDKQVSPSESKTNKPFSKKHSSGGTPFTKHKVSQSLSTPSQKQSAKSNVERKSLHHKSHKVSPSVKKSSHVDEPIKARIEAAERLLHSAPVPPYVPGSSNMSSRKTPALSAKSPVQSSIERAEKLLKNPPVENMAFLPSKEAAATVTEHDKAAVKPPDYKQDRTNFASSKSMSDAIEAVISRASEESIRQDKEAEEAELMKFKHLVSDLSSSDSESDVSVKAEQMLQLQERGLQEAQPATPGSSSVSSLSIDTPPTPNIDDKIDIDSDSDDDIKLPSSKPVELSPVKPKPKADKKEKHKKKSKHKLKASSGSSPKGHSKTKKHNPKPTSFVTTETISPKPVKMKVKLKPFPRNEPKLFDVDKDRDRIKVTTHSSKSSKEEKHKSKEVKHSKTKDHKTPSSKSSADSKHTTNEKEFSVEKIILKKSKSGDAKVVKPKVKEHARSPSPISNRSNLPLPKLSAAVPVSSVTVTAKDKEKKKSKKEKKKRKEREKDRESEKQWSFEKEKQPEKIKKESKDKSSHQKERHKDSEWDSKPSSRRESMDSDASSQLVPKLTLKMGASEKKFVIKQSGSNAKSSGKKRSHSSVADSPVPTKERKVSVECVKTVSEGFAAAVERKVITQTISVGPVGVYEDAEGNKIWICPGCNKPDDGSPMIGCDTCDDWYHWPCVGINREPPDDQDWYCPRCIKRQQLAAKGKLTIKKKKKK